MMTTQRIDILARPRFEAPGGSVWCFLVPVDMDAVLAKVADLVDGVDQDNEQCRPFVRVSLGNVAEATSRINSLGYRTEVA